MIEAYLRQNKLFIDYNEVILVEYPMYSFWTKQMCKCLGMDH